MVEVDFSGAINKMMAFCAYQERCRQEVFQKLEKFDLPDEQKISIIEELEKEKFINEARFAKSYAEGKFRIKKWGRIRIRMELKRRNIPEDLIKESISGIDGDKYFEVLKELVEKKMPSVLKDNLEIQKQKVLRFAYSRGFEPDLTSDAFEEVKKNLSKEKF
ncbi:MAG: RecX family transcriptional regulator [Bacteroidetes bacterium]|nr:RecX family transcriptional regulator [Bacteroidota bacterium]